MPSRFDSGLWDFEQSGLPERSLEIGPECDGYPLGTHFLIKTRAPQEFEPRLQIGATAGQGPDLFAAMSK